MKLRVHADDLGACPAVTDAILQCHSRGVLQSSSLLMNMVGTKDALAKLPEYPELEVSLHLNLIEGRPLSPPDEIPLLVDSEGLFPGRLGPLLLAGLHPGKGEPLQAQIYRELQAQFQRFCAHLPPTWVDGHLHLHLLPWVYPVVTRLAADFGFSSMRLPRRIYFLDGYGSENRLAQRVKESVLSLLSGLYRRRGGGGRDDYLLTGVLAPEVLERVLARLPKAATVELLFHPGAPPEFESELAALPPALRQAHFHPVRGRERDLLTSGDFAAFLQAYEPSGPRDQE